jgi:hypothetical protein
MSGDCDVVEADVGGVPGAEHARDHERCVVQATPARELYDEMLKLYPDWINRGALWTSVRAVKP